MICDFFKISGDIALLRFIERSKKERQLSSLRHEVGRSIISNLRQTYWQQIGESVQEASWKVGRDEIFVVSLRPRDDIRRQEIRLLQIEINGLKTSRAEKQGFSFRAKEKGMEKAKKMTKTTQRGDCIRWITKGQCSFGDSAHSTKNQTKKK